MTLLQLVLQPLRKDLAAVLRGDPTARTAVPAETSPVAVLHGDPTVRRVAGLEQNKSKSPLYCV